MRPSRQYLIIEGIAFREVGFDIKVEALENLIRFLLKFHIVGSYDFVVVS